MERTINRWITGILLLAFVSIIALAAGRQTANTATNVLVTNTTAQSVPVHDSAHGKDGLLIYRKMAIAAGSQYGEVAISSISGERFVITHANCSMTGDQIAAAELSIGDRYGHTVAFERFIGNTISAANGEFSSASGDTLLYLDPGQTLYVTVYRSDANIDWTADCDIAGYRVAYP